MICLCGFYRFAIFFSAFVYGVLFFLWVYRTLV